MYATRVSIKRLTNAFAIALVSCINNIASRKHCMVIIIIIIIITIIIILLLVYQRKRNTARLFRVLLPRYRDMEAS